MRVWFVPLNELSDLHILGQHQEWHMLESMMRNPRFQNHPMVKFFSDKRSWLGKFHQALVDELEHRFDHLKRYNGVHPTPIPLFFDKPLVSEPIFIPATELIVKDKEDIVKRYRANPIKWKWTRRYPPEWLNG